MNNSLHEWLSCKCFCTSQGVAKPFWLCVEAILVHRAEELEEPASQPWPWPWLGVRGRIQVPPHHHK
jgi:hypothetical protein